MSQKSPERICGLYPWFAESGADLVHPDDLEKFAALRPYGCVFDVTWLEDGMIELRYGGSTFRVKPDLLTTVPATRYQLEDAVLCQTQGRLVEAKVEDIGWHHKENRPFFFLRINGKRKSRRYWAEDLQPVVIPDGAEQG